MGKKQTIFRTDEEKARSLCCSGCNEYKCYTLKLRCNKLKDLIAVAEWKEEVLIERGVKFIKDVCHNNSIRSIKDNSFFSEEDLIENFKRFIDSDRLDNGLQTTKI